MVGASKIVIVFQVGTLVWLFLDAIRRKDLDIAKFVVIGTLTASGLLIEGVRALHSPWQLVCLVGQVIVAAGMIPLWRALRASEQGGTPE